MKKVSSIKYQVSRLGKHNAKIWLIIICLFFLATRLYQIDSNPPSLYWDEASIGYNAYSILHTGRDEWGKAFPVHFRAFGEFKLPVYIYSVVLTEAVFDLTPLAIRLPAVLYSLGSLILIYFLVKKITEKEVAGLFAAFGFSISPWLFIFSRTGYEATAGMFFFLLAIYFFLQSQQKKFLLLAAVLSLIFSIYSYNSFRLLSGLTLIIALVYTLWISRTKKAILICSLALLLFIISIIPIIRLLLFDAGFSRTATFALLPNIQQVYDLQGKPHFQIIFDRSHASNWGSNLLNITKNYFSHYSPQFLFQGDANSRNQNPGFGQIYWIDLVLAAMGLFAVWRVSIASLRVRKFHFGLLLFLLLIAPIPAALFKEAPHALRAILMAPILAVFSGIGIWWLVKKFKFLIWPITLIYLVFFSIFFYSFLTSYPIKTSADWQYGYFQIYKLYNDQFSSFDNIIISDDYAEPYIFSLAYSRIDPRIFHKTVVYNSVNDWGFSTVKSYGKFYFVKERNPDLNHPGKSLVFMTKPLGNESFGLFLRDGLPPKQINFLNGQPALFVYTMEK